MNEIIFCIHTFTTTQDIRTWNVKRIIHTRFQIHTNIAHEYARINSVREIPFSANNIPPLVLLSWEKRKWNYICKEKGANWRRVNSKVWLFSIFSSFSLFALFHSNYSRIANISCVQLCLWCGHETTAQNVYAVSFDSRRILSFWYFYWQFLT